MLPTKAWPDCALPVPTSEGRHAGARRRGFAKLWKKACRDAGVPGRLLHDFGRAIVRNLERAGVARSVAMKTAGPRNRKEARGHFPGHNQHRLA
jgi:hypothetical protein